MCDFQAINPVSQMHNYFHHHDDGDLIHGCHGDLQPAQLMLTFHAHGEYEAAFDAARTH